MKAIWPIQRLDSKLGPAVRVGASIFPITVKLNTASVMNLKCKICKCSIHQVGSHYCQTCAYQKGICAMCGKRILNTSGLRQSTV
ncbi:hypothetical protein TELCIR_02645 [Teladorsagia circumcincta]|uniref:Cysteine-rich PDZ-binding protein n=1 Tax=Teladorsagia circumcincta TaxID=45464 RepID=A0A2G9UYJ5_TELCI|nr:hypothetical protein TELCIR_02645 [Teladorsagia circumcincta]